RVGLHRLGPVPFSARRCQLAIGRAEGRAVAANSTGIHPLIFRLLTACPELEEAWAQERIDDQEEPLPYIRHRHWPRLWLPHTPRAKSHASLRYSARLNRLLLPVHQRNRNWSWSASSKIFRVPWAGPDSKPMPFGS